MNNRHYVKYRSNGLIHYAYEFNIHGDAYFFLFCERRLRGLTPYLDKEYVAIEEGEVNCLECLAK